MNNNATAPCCAWRNPKTILILIAMLMLGAIIIVSILRDRIVNRDNWQISVIGQGKISYQPDIANINMGVKVDNVEKAEDALNQLNDKMKKINEAIEKLGIGKDNIQTQNYMLVPHYANSSDNLVNSNLSDSKKTGYDANQIIVVKARGIKENNEIVSKIIAEASKAGVNQVNGIAFESSLLNDLKQEARLKAIADARSKAKDTSKALGVRLGKVVGWYENYIYPETQTYQSDMGGVGGGGSPVIPTGTYEITMEVNISYLLK